MRNENTSKGITVYLEGQIDTTNAEKTGSEIVEIRNANLDGALILDCENLKYISSAGLRQILRLKKSNKDFKIINVNSELYGIFDMTGFTEMMDIQKAYRSVSIEGCEILGEGSNGIVYQINPDTIIKVYKNNNALSEIKREIDLARKALVMGVNTAIPYDIVKVNNNFGAIFELINCKSLSKWILEDPENEDKYIKVFVDVLKDIHNTEVKEGVLPNEKEIALDWVRYLNGHIDEQHYNKLYKLIEDVPESNMMIHGDYHSNNVHYNKQEAILIDMDTIAHGNPIFEWACIYNAYIGFGITDVSKVERFLKIKYEHAGEIFRKALQLYCGKEDIEDEIYKCKAIGLARVLRRTLKRDPENITFIEETKKQLFEAIDKVDTLVL